MDNVVNQKNVAQDVANIVLQDYERQPVECWTRVMGYFRPFSYFNAGKKSEFKDRVWFIEKKLHNMVNVTKNAVQH